MKYTIQVLVENKFGVLARISSLFSARGYNISSLAVGETKDPTISCMTIVVEANQERILEQITKQLHKLIDVITVTNFTHREYVGRELALLKVNRKDDTLKLLNDLAKRYSIKIIEDNEKYFIVEVCAAHNSLEDIFKVLNRPGIKELVRTGKIVISGVQGAPVAKLQSTRPTCGEERESS